MAERRPMKLAYLTTLYPKTSHSFIRREIHELERRGHEVLRIAVREPEEALAEPLDRREQAKTLYCIPHGFVRAFRQLARGVAVEALRRPERLGRALVMALRMSGPSERGLLRHLAYLAEAAFLRQRLEREGVDHLHVHFGTNPAAVARLLRALGGPRYSLTLHGPDEWDAPRALGLREKIRDAAFVAAISHHGAAQARRWCDPEDWHKIRVIRSGAPDRALERAGPIHPGSRALLFVGRLTAQKAPLFLVDAMAELVRRGSDAKLCVIGDGELRGAMETRIRALGLESRVELLGWQSEQQVLDRIDEARCVVLSSFAEGLPVVLIEALAMKTPVVATWVAGIPELVEDGRSGWLVPSGDLGALVEAMWRALQTPSEELDAMGRAGQARVRKQHDLATQVGRLEAAFEAATRAGHGPHASSRPGPRPR